MIAFTTIETIYVTGRGMEHFVAYPVEKRESEIIRELVGSTVLLDGVERRVIAVESWLVPSKVVKAGETIGIVVAPKLEESEP